jgi:hypothetical protein
MSKKKKNSKQDEPTHPIIKVEKTKSLHLHFCPEYEAKYQRIREVVTKIGPPPGR